MSRNHVFLRQSSLSCQAVIEYAEQLCKACPLRWQQNVQIPSVNRNFCRLPRTAAVFRQMEPQAFWEACQSFWFVQLLIQIESSGHSISPGRFDQYMYPYYKADIDKGIITREAAQELLDCIWVKLNDLNKCRDAASAEGFAGYSLFQNLIVGGQDKDGNDVTNDLSLCVSLHLCMYTCRCLPFPSVYGMALRTNC